MLFYLELKLLKAFFSWKKLSKIRLNTSCEAIKEMTRLREKQSHTIVKLLATELVV